jgi:DNA primase
LPDGAFRDLMAAELEKRTGTRGAVAPRAPAARNGAAGAANAPRRTLERSAISLLLANPALAQDVAAPYAFARLDKPGVGLLIELLDAARARPGINTVLLLEQFASRAEADALQKLALTEFPGEPEALRMEFLGAMRRLGEQTTQQRLDALIRRQAEGALDAAEKDELRALLAQKGGASR